MWRSHVLRRWGMLLGVVALGTSPAWALTITLTDANADYFDDGVDPCPRGDVNDDCYVSSYLNTTTAANEYWEVFDKGWTAWNNAQPLGSKWTLVHGPALQGTLNITKFDTYNDCPSTGGVEVRAFFTPAGSDPTSWSWAQGLHDNYLVGAAPPHNSAPPAAIREMDVNAGGPTLPPLYPHQYADGHFYDKPGAYCLHNSNVYFYAVALIVSADYGTRTLTAYEGFSYGFDYTCVHIPEPATAVLVCFGALACLRRRCRT